MPVPWYETPWLQTSALLAVVLILIWIGRGMVENRGPTRHRKKWHYSGLGFWPVELLEDLFSSLLVGLRWFLQALAGVSLPPGPRRGFQRITFVISLAAFPLVLLFLLVAVPAPRLLPCLIASLAAAAIPWVVFHLARWVLHGFRG